MLTLKPVNCVPGPHKPSRSMYAMWSRSVTPVAEQ